MSTIVSRKMLTNGPLGQPDMESDAQRLDHGDYGAQEYLVEEVQPASKANEPKFAFWSFAFFSDGQGIYLASPYALGKGQKAAKVTKWYTSMGGGPGTNGGLVVKAFSLTRQEFILDVDPVDHRVGDTITAKSWIGPWLTAEKFQAWWWFPSKPVPKSTSAELTLPQNAQGLLLALYKLEREEFPWRQPRYDIPRLRRLVPALEQLLEVLESQPPAGDASPAIENDLRALDARLEALERRLDIH